MIICNRSVMMLVKSVTERCVPVMFDHNCCCHVQNTADVIKGDHRERVAKYALEYSGLSL